MNLGIYIHIPFCVSKCFYCNFYSINKLDLINDYLLSLTTEINKESKKYTDFNIDTIFIGGGTPSILPIGSISLILKTIKENFNVDKDCEITIESNPNSVEYSKALEWIDAGVNRVSVGLQTTSNNLLKKIGRAHTFQDFLNAMQILKSVGFKNINTDIMLGLPSQKLSDVKTTLKYCFSLGVAHISAYTLILEPDTPLYNKVSSGEVHLPKEEKVISMFDYVLTATKNYGFDRYEVSNFSKPNYECRHNLNCWNMCQYVGFGCGAHSFVNNQRFFNISDVFKYIENINHNLSVVKESENCKKADLAQDYVMLALRTKEGININKLKNDYDYDILKLKENVINKFADNNFLKYDKNFIRLTTKGFYVLNQIILELVD